jgi:hypothetical protein
MQQCEKGDGRDQEHEVCAPTEAIDERGAASRQDEKQQSREEESLKHYDDPRKGEITPLQLSDAATDSPDSRTPE